MAKKKKRLNDFAIDRNETFAFIAGYTAGGAPFGITWEEYEKMEGENKQRTTDKDERFPKVSEIEDCDLPF